MKKTYHIVTRAARESAAVIEQFCQTNGQILLPIVNLIQNASQVVETVIHEVGHQMLEQILVLSAEQVAGARTPGKASGDIRHHGSQPGCVQLADRKVKVKRPRLRHKTEGEVKIPAYEALQQDRGLGQHMLGALLRGVSTREYQEVLPQMAETVGVSRSAISRKAVEASAEQLKQLQERRWENVEILVIYIDGQRFGEHHILSAVGVDTEGKKHILGIESGATENAASVKRLLTRLRDHGLPTDRKYLFVIDGAKALRAAIEEVFGDDQPVQRCRNHKLRNVVDELPKEQQGQALNLLRAAWKVKTAEEGEQAAGAISAISGAGSRERRAQPAGGHERDVHAAAPEDSQIAPQMPGNYQHYRKPTGRRRAPHAQRDALARRRYGAAVGRFRMGAHREALPSHRRPRRSLGLGSDSGAGDEVDHSAIKGESSLR